jgi:glucose/arabinose dehydrogenase
MKRLTDFLPRLVVAGILCCLFASPFSLTRTLAAAPLTLPTGFTDTVVVSGLLGARDFVFMPDDRILILERGNITTTSGDYASVRIYDPVQGELLPGAALILDTCGNSERGAVGITIDPNFSTNHYVYIYYSRPNTLHSCPEQTNQVLNRLSRFTMSGDTINPASEVVLLNNIQSYWGYHNAGDINFDSAGYLYVSVGNGGLEGPPDAAQLLDSLNGKILRIKPDTNAARGYVTTNNPYESATGAHYCGTTPPESGSGPCREIYAYGFRNPFRFTIVPSVPGVFSAADIGHPLLGDVGSNAWEEVNIAYPDANQNYLHGNYGWPNVEGPCTPKGTLCAEIAYQNDPAYTKPIYFYPHLNPGEAFADSAIIGGAFYTGNSYPAQYRNSYFFTDYVRGFVRQLKYDSGNWTAVAPDFATGGTSIIGILAGPGTAQWGDDLYYVNKPDETDSTRVSEIRRISYGLGNAAPVATINVDKVNNPSLSYNYTFSAAGSYDPDNNTPLSYEWDFGDGATQTTTVPTAKHIYASPTNRTATLVVKDKLGKPSTPATIMVYPGNTAPTGTLVVSNITDPARAKYYAGDSWSYQINNPTDAEDGPLAPSAIAWSVVFHHQTHTHPFQSGLNGFSGTFAIPTGNEPDPVQWYRVHVLMTDLRGQTVEIYKDVVPTTATLTLMTSPSGGKVIFEGSQRQTPYVVTRVAGFDLTIDAPATLTLGSTSYDFGSWLPLSGPKSQTIRMPAVATTLTAQYGQYGQAARNYTTTQPTLTWSPVSWATAYELQISASPTFAVLYPVTGNPFPSTTLQYTTSGLPNGLFYWRVRAKNSAGVWGPWGKADSFVIGP